MDFFNEHIVARKKGSKEYLFTAAIILGAILLIFVLMLFLNYLQSFFLLLVAGVIYFMYIGITSMNIEYEYIVTNGELDIDKIAARRKRTRILSVHSRSFEYFAPLNSEHKNAYDNTGITKRLDLTSNTGSSGVYFFIYYKNNDKICVTFEPTEKMIECFSEYVPSRACFKA